MSVRCGVDLCDPWRIKRIIERHGDRFIHKIFTEKEIAYCSSRSGSIYHSYAARFAAKEAVMKLLGLGIGKISFKDIEITNDSERRPSVVLHASAREIANALGVIGMDLSLSHEKNMAVAMVMAVVSI